MPYNKEAIYKFKHAHPEEYTVMTRKHALEYRWRNIEAVRAKDRLRSTPFMKEWLSFRKIDIF
jgi:hypothetical protein